MPVEHQGCFCKPHHIINAANNLPLHAKHQCQIKPLVTSDIKMMGKKQRRIKFLQPQCTSCLTQNFLLTHLIFFYPCKDIAACTGVGRVAASVNVIPCHAAKGHELYDGLILEFEGGCSHLVRVILGAGEGGAVGHVAEVLANLLGSDQQRLVASERCVGIML